MITKGTYKNQEYIILTNGYRQTIQVCGHWHIITDTRIGAINYCKKTIDKQRKDMI